MKITSRLLAALTIGSITLAACGGHSVTLPTTTSGSQSQAGSRAPAALPTLGAYHVNPSKVFVAGISSGGFMDVQLHVAYSGTYKGSATYAGGVEYCADDSESSALLDCGGIDNGDYASELSVSENYISANQNTSKMDPISNITNQPVYLWHGTADDMVPAGTMNDLKTEYSHYGASPITYDSTYTADHGWESPYGEVACGTQASPYMINCGGYDSEKTWMTMFFGTLNAKNTGTLNGTLINFDQTPYGGGSNSLDTNGYLFVPSNCASGTTCNLVVAIHGCAQYQSSIGTKFISESGIDQWADTNNVLVLYPYATTSSSNPNGCWDWWGYVNSDYADKNGPQMSFIYNMTKHIMSGGGATPTPTPTATPTGPTPTPTPPPTPTPTPTPTSLGCWNTNNYAHVSAGRAYLQDSTGDALANGSNQNMGLDNTYYTTILKETSSNYYIIVSSC